MRRTVLGDAHVDALQDSAEPLIQRLQSIVMENAWGAVWARPGLDLRSRSIATVAILAAAGKAAELKNHLRGAERNGLTETELFELLVHCSAYAGMPASVDAIRTYAHLLEEGKN